MNTCYLNFNSNVQYLFPQNTDMLSPLLIVIKMSVFSDNRYFGNPIIFYQCHNSNIIDFNQLIHLRQSNRCKNRVLTFSLKRMGIVLFAEINLYFQKECVKRINWFSSIVFWCDVKKNTIALEKRREMRVTEKVAGIISFFWIPDSFFLKLYKSSKCIS